VLRRVADIASVKERRYSYRVDTDLPVICYPLDPSGLPGVPFRAVARDLCSTGVSLHVGEHAPLVSQFGIKFHSDDPPLDLIVLGEVVRVRRAPELRLGIRFKGMSLETRSNLTRYVFIEARRQHDAQLEPAPLDANDFSDAARAELAEELAAAAERAAHEFEVEDDEFEDEVEVEVAEEEPAAEPEAPVVDRIGSWLAPKRVFNGYRDLLRRRAS
jgi:hypothetical protein